MRIFIFTIFLAHFADCSLKFVQIWFRHGERLPTHFLRFPGEDPNNFDYLNIGYPGELTNRGIGEEFQLGEKLAEIYGPHFGDTYRPNDFHVYTGKDNRTSTSAQAFFAGFFPPNVDQRWSKTLNWQPVAQETDQSLDWVSLGALDNCPVYGTTYSTSEEYDNVMKFVAKQDPKLLEVVRQYTNETISTASRYNHAIDSLKVRGILNDTRLPVPQWAVQYHDQIYAMSYLIHEAVVKSQNFTIGNYHVELVMSFFESYFIKNNTKGVFVSGHDTNIVAIWEALQLDGHPKDIPSFGAHLAIELHEIDGLLSVRFFLAMGYNQERIEIIPKFCGGVCSWDKLQQITTNARKPRSDWAFECKGIEKAGEPVSTITGSMIVLLSILLLSTIILAFTTISYKRQINNLRDPERARLL